MFYRLKNKKGFTLIELIVVIAILGILALIAIPRFLGFTNRGRIAADEQYGALIANATLVIAAAGELPLTPIQDGDIVITITQNAATPPLGLVTVLTVETVAGTHTALTAEQLTAYNLRLTPMVAPQGLKYHTTNLIVTTSDSGVKSFNGTPAKP